MSRVPAFDALSSPAAPDLGAPAQLLDRALAADPARPLLTFYDDASGERAELSVATFANWVAKTANLLRDELAVESGGTVAVRLPVHWQAAVWLQAAWALGCLVDLAHTGTPEVEGTARVADVAVVEHTAARLAGLRADEVVSLGLGPMGLARPGSVPAYAGALDYDRAVHAHGDRFQPDTRPDPLAPALRAAGTVTTGADLVAAATGFPPVARGGRLLVTEPYTSVASVVRGLLVPLATSAGAVLCRHLDPARLPDRMVQEHVVGSP